MIVFDQGDLRSLCTLGNLSRCYNDSMECKHVYMENTIEMDNGGYMIMKTCIDCYDTSGYGFLDKNHEQVYLNTLLHQGELDER
jgi:hypothetical protein